MNFNEKYYDGLHYHQKINTEHIKKLEALLNDENCNIFDRIKIVQRIGSNSLYATVWEAEFYLSQTEKIKLAIKVQKNIDKSLSEIDINNFLQNVSGSYHFLPFYGNIYCDNIRLMGEKFNGYFMFMELATGDLAQYLSRKSVSEKELINFILQVYEGIYVLGKHQIFHGDLHLKNVFIVDGKAVIGDFGESTATDSITAHTSDLIKFSSSLIEYLNIIKKYNNVRSKLNNVIKTINRMTPQIEDSYDRFLEGGGSESDEFFEKTIRNTIDRASEILLGD